LGSPASREELKPNTDENSLPDQMPPAAILYGWRLFGLGQEMRSNRQSRWSGFERDSVKYP
jgi:hypothetical protein